MNEQKDTEKTKLNSYGQANVSNTKTLINNDYLSINKKTEKLVTALYMVTDCMASDDALKGKLRMLGVELLSDIYKLSTISSIEKSNHFPLLSAHIYEVLSFLEISATIGFISEMNMQILKREFISLIGELETYQSRDKHFTFVLDEQMFSLPVAQSQNKNLTQNNPNNDNGHIKDKRTTINNPQSILSNYKKDMPTGTKLLMSDKHDRADKIISLIKDRKDLPEGDSGVSIKDISIAFTDCSEKTIQRELNSLVSKGQIKKAGSKRWSRYSLSTTTN